MSYAQPMALPSIVGNVALQVMMELKRLRTSGFSGIGVVFYKPPLKLPIAPLGKPSTTKPGLPVQGVSDIAMTLASVSDKASPWHDGFHLVDVQSLALTHIAQFISPPLVHVSDIASDAQPAGARQMTALLTSRIPCVYSVALLSAAGEISFYSEGMLNTFLGDKHE
ncbi:MAG: hypothetical protein PSV26_11915 [Polaromonas sp.]|uniref:hypothetical protein n=1 Tax=Polaromonas sp. TaxID=1869339 RepID=UPI002486F474|nr:hypothetical protein [Polaromonas sp.]MDI1238180.1 hypothetical protein [Polaromonas sp.]